MDNNIITGSSCLAAAQATPTTSAATATAAPTSAATQAAAVSATATLLPVVTGLPSTGGAPINSEDSPWSWVTLIGLIGIGLAFGIGRRYLNTNRPKQ
jgi:hypothetical protein